MGRTDSTRQLARSDLFLEGSVGAVSSRALVHTSLAVLLTPSDFFTFSTVVAL